MEVSVTDIVEFNSDSNHFEDEKSGIKNNTTRIIDLEDKRFNILIEMWKRNQYGKIRINKKGGIYGNNEKAINVHEDKHHSFMRYIQHIAVYKQLMIITWEIPTKTT